MEQSHGLAWRSLYLRPGPWNPLSPVPVGVTFSVNSDCRSQSGGTAHPPVLLWTELGFQINGHLSESYVWFSINREVPLTWNHFFRQLHLRRLANCFIDWNKWVTTLSLECLFVEHPEDLCWLLVLVGVTSFTTAWYLISTGVPLASTRVI